MTRRRIQRRQRDPRYCNVFLDTNALDRVDPERSAFVDEFHDYEENLPLSVIKPHGVEAEANHPHTPPQVREDMDGIYTLDVPKTSDEQNLLRQLRTIMQGNAQVGKHDADADHLFEAAKNGGGYFVTHDTRILSRAIDVRSICPGLEIVTLEDFLAICHRLEQEGE